MGHRKCSITIAGLQGNTPYDVYCAAEDADGLSDISEPVDGTTAMQGAHTSATLSSQTTH